MNTLKVYISFNNETKTHYYDTFTIETILPQHEYNNERIINRENVEIDCEQGNEKVYQYNYYIITTFNEEEYNNDLTRYTDIQKSDYVNKYNIAILKKED